MTKNQDLTDRVRTRLANIPRVEEKKMFGGITFMVNGKMCVTVGHGRLMCRIGSAIQDKVLKRKGCEIVKMKGREYRGFVYVSEEGLKAEKDFEYWIQLAMDFNKKAKAPTKRKKK
jgi:TfoX/Sxy family transcriptional regulator of competence genes